MSKWNLSGCILLCAVHLSYGDVQTFVNDYAGFASAAGTLAVIDFETQPNGQPSQAGVQITAAYNYDAYGVHSSAPNVTPILAGNPVGGFSLRADIPVPNASSRTWIVADPLEPVSAAGGHFGGGSFLFAYDANSELMASLYYYEGGPGHFLGIVSTTPIDYVVFDRLGYSASINDFHLSPIPEPASAVLLATGACWLIRVRRPSRRPASLSTQRTSSPTPSSTTA